MAANDSAAPRIVVKPWETRTIELALIGIGAVLLAFAGFAAAFPFQLGPGTSNQSTSTAPVTLAHVTTLGTTPTVVTEVRLRPTSSSARSRDSSEAWLGTIFGIGALLVLSGAVYRRIASLSGFGFSIGLQGVVDDPAVQSAVAEKVSAAAPDATPEQAALISAKALSNLATSRPQCEVTVKPPSARPLWARFRISPLASRVKSSGTELAIPSDADIETAVADAADEVLK
jgi:hypothetical protein